MSGPLLTGTEAHAANIADNPTVVSARVMV
jgi:hypothetical protein